MVSRELIEQLLKPERDLAEPIKLNLEIHDEGHFKFVEKPKRTPS